MTVRPDPIDVAVGKQIRARRTDLGMSQTELGAELGITFQQIQKYEKGANRVSASALYKIAGVLKVPLSYLFGGHLGYSVTTDDPDEIELLVLFRQIRVEDEELLHPFMVMMKTIVERTHKKRR